MSTSSRFNQSNKRMKIKFSSVSIIRPGRKKPLAIGFIFLFLLSSIYIVIQPEETSTLSVSLTTGWHSPSAPNSDDTVQFWQMGYLSMEYWGRISQLFYRLAGSGTWSSVYWVPPTTSLNYWHVVGTLTPGNYEYYYRAKGQLPYSPYSMNYAYLPSSGYYTFTVTASNDPPYQPTNYWIEDSGQATQWQTIEIQADLDDPDGYSNIQSANVQYRYKSCDTCSYGVTNNGQMTNIGGMRWSYSFPTTFMLYGSTFEYKIRPYDGQYYTEGTYKYFYVTKELQAPTFSTITWVPNPAESGPSSVTLTATIYDSLSGVKTTTQDKHFKWRIDYGNQVYGSWNYVPATSVTGASNSQVTYHADVTNLPYTTTDTLELYAYGYDDQMNYGLVGPYTQYQIGDGTPPLAVDTPQLQNGPTVGNDQDSIWKIHLTDVGGGIVAANIEYSFDNSNWVTSGTLLLQAGEGTQFDGYWQGSVAPQLKNYNLYVRAAFKDQFNGYQYSQSNGPFLINDYLAPSIDSFAMEVGTPTPLSVGQSFYYVAQIYDDDDVNIIATGGMKLLYRYRIGAGQASAWFDVPGGSAIADHPTNWWKFLVPSSLLIYDLQIRYLEFKAYAEDDVGNSIESLDPASYPITDNTNPTLNFVSISDNPPVSARNVTVTYSASDAGSGIQSVILTYCFTLLNEQCSNQEINEYNVAMQPTGNSDEFSLIVFMSIPATKDGTTDPEFKFAATVTDIAGNPTTETFREYSVVDGDAPIAIFVFDEYGPYSNLDMPYIDVTVFDVGSMLATSSILMWRTWNPYAGTGGQWSEWSYEYNSLVMDPDGDSGHITYTFPAMPYGSMIEFNVIATDTSPLANQANQYFSFNITVDAIPPDLNGMTVSNPSNLYSNLPITMDMGENGTGIDHVLVKYHAMELVHHNATINFDINGNYIGTTAEYDTYEWVAHSNLFNQDNITIITHPENIYYLTWEIVNTIPRTRYGYDPSVPNSELTKMQILVYDVADNYNIYSNYLTTTDDMPPSINSTSVISKGDNLYETRVNAIVDTLSMENGVDWGSSALTDVQLWYKVGMGGSWMQGSISDNTYTGFKKASVTGSIPAADYLDNVYYYWYASDASGNTVTYGNDSSLFFTIEDRIAPSFYFVPEVSGSNIIDTSFDVTIIDYSSGISNLVLIYYLDQSLTKNYGVVTNISDLYSFVIPKQDQGTLVTWVINAIDIDDNVGQLTGEYISSDGLGPTISTSIVKSLIGESGRIAIKGDPSFIYFDNSYVDPVVITTSYSNTGATIISGSTWAQTVVIHNVSSFGFWISQFEDGVNASNDGVNSTLVNYMVFESGRYLLDNTELIIGKVNVTTSDTIVNFPYAMTAEPVVFASTMSLRNGLQQIRAVLKSQTTSDFTMQLVNGSHDLSFTMPSSEIVGYVIADVKDSNLMYWNNTSTDRAYSFDQEITRFYANTSDSIAFNRSYSEIPITISSLLTGSQNYYPVIANAQSDTILIEGQYPNSGLNSSISITGSIFTTYRGGIYAHVVENDQITLITTVTDDDRIIYAIIDVYVNGSLISSQSMTEINFNQFSTDIAYSSLGISVTISITDEFDNTTVYSTDIEVVK